MAWTTPMTAVANEVFTAAQYNTYVRDNLLETAPGIAQFPSQYFYKLGDQLYANTFGSSNVNMGYTTTSTTYVDLEDGPLPTMSRRIQSAGFIMWLGGQMTNNTAGQACHMSVEITRESDDVVVFAPDDSVAFSAQTTNAAICSMSGPHFIPGITDDIYTFTMKYRVTGGTGTFAGRWLHVMPF